MMNCDKFPVWSVKPKEQERGEGGSQLGHILATVTAYRAPITDDPAENNAY